MTQRRLELLSMGRVAVDLYAEQIGAELEDASTLAKYVGGCPGNIAIGSSRLGLKVGMLSRVGNESMGNFVRKTLQNEGVDTRWLATDPERLTALALLGVNPPDQFPLLFYRTDCADMAIIESDFSLDTMQETKALLISGTHCSTDHAYAVTRHAVQLAIEADTEVILDVDFRPQLWKGGKEEFQKRLKPLMAVCDLIVGTEEELVAAAGDDPIQNLKKTTTALIVEKKGARGCTAYPPGSSEPVSGNPFDVSILNVLGAGDAFMSGFLRGYLRNKPLEECCNLGNACGALVVTRHGCSPAMPYWSELLSFLQDPAEVDQASRIHSVLGRPQRPKELSFVAFDHRTQLEAICREAEKPMSEITRFKELIYEALKEASPNLGIIIDDTYGKGILHKASATTRPVARAIEAPGSAPLAFLDHKESHAILSTWPKHHIVKALCHIPPAADPSYELQIERLKQLSESASTTGHELMIELLPGEDVLEVKQMMIDLYAQSVYPSYWKLPANFETGHWYEIQSVIEAHDPHCRGILLLGGNTALDTLAEQAEAVRRHIPLVCGFAVGRTVWQGAAESWFNGQCSDTQAIQQIVSQITQLTSVPEPV